MGRLPLEIYVVGAVIVAINVGMGLWFGGILGTINIVNAFVLTGVLLWSALGAPGVERLPQLIG